MARIEGFLKVMLVAVALLAGEAVAAGGESAAALKAGVEQYVRTETMGLPGTVTVIATPPDSRLHLAACPQVVYSVPPGVRLWGSASVNAACPGHWQLQIPVMVRITAPVLIATHTLSAGQPVTTSDFVAEPREVTALPPGVVENPAAIKGRVLTRQVQAGMVLRTEMLRAPWVVKSGQQVHLHAGTASFSVDTEGQAMANATAGQSINFRLPTGKVVRATVQPDGTANVNW